jgi:hypothetical protein
VNVNGDLTVTGGDIDVSGEASLLSILDNDAASFAINDGSYTYFNLDTTTDAEVITLGNSSGNTGITFDIGGTGNITFPDFANCTLKTSGGVLQCGSDLQGGGTNYWQLNAEVISPYNETLDVTFGGISTESARFAVLNMDAGASAPTASLSAGIAGGMYMTADGTLTTTTGQALTIGGSDAGGITIDAGVGAITLSDNVDATNGLDVTNANLTVGGSNVTIDVSTGDITTIGGVVLGDATTDITTESNENLNITANGTGDVVFDLDGDTEIQITAGAAPTIDMVAISNSGQATISDAVDGLSIDFTAAAGTTENAGAHVTVTGSGAAGDTMNGLQVTSAGIADGNLNGIVIDTISGGSGTEYAINIEAGWDDGLYVADATNAAINLASTDGDAASGILFGGDIQVFRDEAKELVITDGAGNSFVFDLINGPTASGSARPINAIAISPEYPGASLTGDGGGDNTGTMTSDNTTSTLYRNYYDWTTTQGTAQDYDIWVKVQVPSDFVAWANNNTLSIDTWTNDTTNGPINVTVYDTDETADCTSQDFTPSTGSTWESVTSTACLDTGTYTPGEEMTIMIKLTAAATTGDTRVSTIKMEYYAGY